MEHYLQAGAMGLLALVIVGIGGFLRMHLPAVHAAFSAQLEAERTMWRAELADARASYRSALADLSAKFETSQERQAKAIESLTQQLQSLARELHDITKSYKHAQQEATDDGR